MPESLWRYWIRMRIFKYLIYITYVDLELKPATDRPNLAISFFCHIWIVHRSINANSKANIECRIHDFPNSYTHTHQQYIAKTQMIPQKKNWQRNLFLLRAHFLRFTTRKKRERIMICCFGKTKVMAENGNNQIPIALFSASRIYVRHSTA